MKAFVAKTGQKVTKGSLLGYVGSTGNSTGPHLHFQMTNSAGKRFNPWEYIFGKKKWPGEVDRADLERHHGNLMLNTGGMLWDEYPAILQRGETVVAKDDTPILMSLLNRVGSLDVNNTNNNTNTVDIQFNLTMPDGSVRTFEQQVIGIPNSRVLVEREL